MKLDTTENIIEILDKIISEKDINEKNRLAYQFADTVLDTEEDIVSVEVDDVLSDLAIEINYFVANEVHRKEDSSYYGPEKLDSNLAETIQKLHNFKNLIH